MRALSFPFRFSGGNVASTTSYDEMVRGQIVDALMTNQLERVMRPLYGCDIQAALFDPLDELDRRDAAGVIRKRIEAYCPRAFVRSVDINLPGGAILEIKIVYRASQIGTDIALTVPISTSEFIARGQLNPEANFNV